IPWYHHITLLDKVKNDQERLWYMQQTIEHGWSRNVLSIQIETHLYQRKGKAITNFYLTAVDEQVKHSDDHPTIGIILCKSKSKVKAEYALRNIQSPMGVATYQLTTSLPEALKDQLPDIRELEASLQEIGEDI